MLLSLLIPVVLASTSLESLLNEAQSFATVEVTGNGTAIELTYTSADPFTVVVVFDAKNFVQAEFAAGEKTTQALDLTQSTLWSPRERDYTVHFVSSSNSPPEFHDIEFIEPTFLTNLSSFLYHLSSSPPYSPSIYHTVPPYRVFGISLTTILGILMMILVLLTRSTKVGLLMVLLFSARFSIDALGYSVTHTSEWMAQRTYATAGALPQIGADLQDMNVQSTYLCSTGTSYAWRALSYHSYPVLLTEQNPDSVVVHKSTDFAFDGQTLRCAEDTFTASLIKTYPDDSSLYLVQ